MNSSKLDLLWQWVKALQGRTSVVVSFLVWTWEGHVFLPLMYIPNSLAHILVHNSIHVSKLSGSPAVLQIWVSYPWSSAVQVTCFPTAMLSTLNLLSWRKTYIPMNRPFGFYYVLGASSLPLLIPTSSPSFLTDRLVCLQQSQHGLLWGVHLNKAQPSKSMTLCPLPHGIHL